MSGNFGKLTALKVSRLDKPGYYGDGGGLYLQVSTTGSKSWIFRFQQAKQRREMGLGSIQTVTLVDARERARVARLCLIDGVDPIEQRSGKIADIRSSQLMSLDFDECARQYIEAHEASWRNAKHRLQWESTLRIHASPHLGSVQVRRIDTSLVLKVLEPIWRTKTETASRIRERMERVLAWATVKGYREGDNPARWRNHLEEMLPAPEKVKKVRHYSALSYLEIAGFFEALRMQPGNAARAMELVILTATRTGEVLGAKWTEMDFDRRIWTIPAERMKANRPHRVPLVSASLGILQRQMGLDDVYVFPGAKIAKPLSNMAMLTVLRRMNRADITVHGFRSTFRDWAAEKGRHPREVVEMALAHTVGSAVENAYRRSDLLEKRQELLYDWTLECLPTLRGVTAE